MKIAFVGEIDHGKSSLIGRLLLDTKSLKKDNLKELDKISNELGIKACIAFLVDQFIEEREGLMTIDTTEIVVNAGHKSFTCIDTPGHLRLLKNMMTGTSHADAAVLVIDATQGIQEQTRLHLHILKMFGIRSIIFAVNKIDLLDFQEKPFRCLEQALQRLALESGLTPTDIIPVSAQEGINITRNSLQTPWYKKQPLLKSILRLKEITDKHKRPLRLPIQDIYTIDGESVIVGRIAQGGMRQNEKVLLSPSMETTQIKEIKIFGQKRMTAGQGENVGLSCRPMLKIKRGDCLCSLNQPLQACHQFQTQILWLSKDTIKENDQINLRVSTQTLLCLVKKIEKTNFPSVFNILFYSDMPALVECFAANQILGRFILEKNNHPAGAGIIIST